MNPLLAAIRTLQDMKPVAGKPNQLLRTVYVKSPSPSAKRHERQATGISARQQKRRRVATLKARQEFGQKPFTSILDSDRQGTQEYILQ